MAAKKKTRGKSQLGKGRWSPTREKQQIRNLSTGRGGPTWAITGWQGLGDDDTTGGRQRQKERSGPTRRWSKHRIAAANRAMQIGSSDASNTPGEKAAPRGGGRAKAAATRAGNIAKSKARGTHVGGKGAMSAQDKRNRARARSDARTRVGGGSPGSRVAGGLARVRGR